MTVSAKELARQLGVSTRWVYDHAKKLGGVKNGKNRWEFPDGFPGGSAFWAGMEMVERLIEQKGYRRQVIGRCESCKLETVLMKGRLSGEPVVVVHPKCVECAIEEEEI